MTVKPILADTPHPDTQDFEHAGDIAPRWLASLENKTREARGLKLYHERGHEIREISPNVYEVPSCSGRGAYLVEYGADVESCNCPDAEFHPEFSCKHLLAVAICRAKHRRPRTYSETVEAVRRDAAAEYRAETRRLMAAGLL